MDKNFINVDELVRQRMGGAEAKEPSGSWLQMRDLLDKEMPQAAAGFNWRRMLSAVTVVALVAAIGVGGYELSGSAKESKPEAATPDNGNALAAMPVHENGAGVTGAEANPAAMNTSEKAHNSAAQLTAANTAGDSRSNANGTANNNAATNAKATGSAVGSRTQNTAATTGTDHMVLGSAVPATNTNEHSTGKPANTNTGFKSTGHKQLPASIDAVRAGADKTTPATAANNQANDNNSAGENKANTPMIKTQYIYKVYTHYVKTGPDEGHNVFDTVSIVEYIPLKKDDANTASAEKTSVETASAPTQHKSSAAPKSSDSAMQKKGSRGQ